MSEIEDIYTQALSDAFDLSEGSISVRTYLDDHGKCTTFGTSYVSEVLEELRSMFKGSRPELGLEAILPGGLHRDRIKSWG